MELEFNQSFVLHGARIPTADLLWSAQDTVYRFLLEAAERWPNLTAVIDDLGELSFAGLHSEAESVRRSLANLGVERGAGVGIALRNGRDFIIALFAVVGCGATAMPLPCHLKPEEYRSLLSSVPLDGVIDANSAEPAGILGAISDAVETTRLSERLRITLRHRSLDARELESFVSHVPCAAFIRYTSGTTGKAKGVVLSHATVHARTLATQRALRLEAGDAVTWVLPMAFHFVASVVTYVRYGVTIVVCPDLLAAEIIKLSNTYRSKLIYGAPLHFQLLGGDASGQMLTSVKFAISTSMGISKEACAKFRARFGIPITQVYGAIELGLPLGNFEGADEWPEAVGQVLPGYSAAILDDHGNPIPPGSLGQLALDGVGIFDAYVEGPRELPGGWFLTGDLAVARENGTICILGRRKSMINVGGNKVFPEEVEGVLEAHPDVQSARVLGRSHQNLGEIVCAEIVPHAGANIDVEELAGFCYRRLSPYKVPKDFNFVSDVSRTRSGKVLRHLSS